MKFRVDNEVVSVKTDRSAYVYAAVIALFLGGMVAGLYRAFVTL